MSRLQQWFNQLQLSLFGDNEVVLTANKKTKPISPSLPKPPLRARMIVLDSQLISYTIERANRRTVGMFIDHAGLRVRASRGVSVMEIERLLQDRAHWILKNLNKMQNIVPCASFVPNLEVIDGAVLPILGRDVRVSWKSDATEFNAEIWFVQQFHAEKGVVHLVLRDVAFTRREKVMREVLSAILLEYLFQRARFYAARHGLRYGTIVLSNARTLWGSCHSNGTLRLNWRLVFLDTSLVDYVLVHELSHTVHMNHSRLFWNKVTEICPDYKSRVQRLKQYNLRVA